MSPALITETTPQMRINREEVFGPVASVVRVKDYDEALAVANDTPFGLTAGIATRSLKHAAHFKRNAAVGMVMVNLPTAGVDYHVPFGGRKGSSYGPREQGAYAKEFYTVVKTAYVQARGRERAGPPQARTNIEVRSTERNRYPCHQTPQEAGRPAQPPLVRRQRPALVRAPVAHGADGLRPLRLHGQAGHRDHQHVERDQLLPQPLPAARGRGQARHLAGRRLSDRDARDLARRAVPEADHDALPQSPRDGDGGAPAQLPRRRRGADGRLRQDDAGARHGRAVDEPADDFRAGGSDAARRLPRRVPGQRQRHLEVLGGASRRQHHAKTTGATSRTASRARPVTA